MFYNEINKDAWRVRNAWRIEKEWKNGTLDFGIIVSSPMTDFSSSPTQIFASFLQEYRVLVPVFDQNRVGKDFTSLWSK